MTRPSPSATTHDTWACCSAGNDNRAVMAPCTRASRLAPTGSPASTSAAMARAAVDHAAWGRTACRALVVVVVVVVDVDLVDVRALGSALGTGAVVAAADFDVVVVVVVVDVDVDVDVGIVAAGGRTTAWVIGGSFTS